jgi:beta-lactamase superfamily II metal-dependent hydrolase
MILEILDVVTACDQTSELNMDNALLKMTNLDVTLTQHPVGQGGMMSGLLEIAGGRFHWVYDCGSNQRDALTREIAKVATNGDVDCLFLSHLDSDHVIGIDQLLANVRVREVMLPYLNDLDCLLLAARDAASGALSGTSLTLLADIPGWFGSRGVDRVTFIEPNNDDEGAPLGPDPPEGGLDRRVEGEIRAKWSGHDQGQASTPIGAETKNLSVTKLQTRETLQLVAPDGLPLDWVLAPYAHRPSAKRLKTFEEALKRMFGRKLLTKKFWLSALTDSEMRIKLRECYGVIWSDHNLVSMALYAGPVLGSDWSGYCVSNPKLWHSCNFQDGVGWLGTGDMHLDVKIRRTNFLNHYKHLLPRVNVFGLPHHGSRHNYDLNLPDAMVNASQFVAATGPNPYDHPSTLVKESVRSKGRQFVKVSNKDRSVLQWRHWA